MTTTSVERIWEALNTQGYHPETRRGNHFAALCPVHGDTHRSLSITYNAQRAMTLLHCFACGATAADILAQLGMTLCDSYDHTTARTQRPHTDSSRRTPVVPPRIAATKPVPLPQTGWVITATYDYTTNDHTVIERVIRRELTIDGVRHKKFVQQFRQTDGSFAWTKPKNFTPVFYRQPVITAAIARGEGIWLLEGEKDVETAVRAGITNATTNAQGASGFPTDLLTQLTTPVTIVADRDLAGYLRARDLKTALTERGITATVYLPATVEEKSDFTNHINAGHTIADLITPTDADLDLLIRAAQITKLYTKQIRRDLNEIDAHLHYHDTTHRDAARYWAHQITATWKAHTAENPLVVSGTHLTTEGWGSLHTIQTLTRTMSTTLHNLHDAGLLTRADKQ